MSQFDDAAGEFADVYGTGIETLTGAVGTVTSVTPGASTDARDLIVVGIDGTDTAAFCSDDLTLTAGQRVLVMLLRGVPIIVCRLGNFPPV